MARRRVGPTPRIQHEVPRVAPVVVDGVEALDVLVDQDANDLEVAIGAVREARFMERRSTELISGLQTRVLEGITQQLHQMHRQRHAGHPCFYRYTVELLRFQVAAIGVRV